MRTVSAITVFTALAGYVAANGPEVAPPTHNGVVTNDPVQAPAAHVNKPVVKEHSVTHKVQKAAHTAVNKWLAGEQARSHEEAKKHEKPAHKLSGYVSSKKVEHESKYHAATKKVEHKHAPTKKVEHKHAPTKKAEHKHAATKKAEHTLKHYSTTKKPSHKLKPYATTKKAAHKTKKPIHKSSKKTSTIKKHKSTRKPTHKVPKVTKSYKAPTAIVGYIGTTTTTVAAYTSVSGSTFVLSTRILATSAAAATSAQQTSSTSSQSEIVQSSSTSVAAKSSSTVVVAASSTTPAVIASSASAVKSSSSVIVIASSTSAAKSTTSAVVLSTSAAATTTSCTTTQSTMTTSVKSTSAAVVTTSQVPSVTSSKASTTDVTTTLSATSGCATVIEAGTYCGFINPEDPCSPQPGGHGPVASPDTVAAFLDYQPLHDMSTQAPSTIAGTKGTYVQIFQDLDASVSAAGYIGLYQLTSYNVQQCANHCDAVEECTSFNMYIERDPSQNPSNGDPAPTVWGNVCPVPASMTTFDCTLWSSVLTKSTATNYGGYRGEFQVAITGSNAYVRSGTS